MIQVYLNYPVARIMVHADPECVYFQRFADAKKRKMVVAVDTFRDVIDQFLREKVRFAAFKGYNDLRLEIHFGDREMEMAVLRSIRKILERRYSRFEQAEIQVHCET